MVWIWFSLWCWSRTASGIREDHIGGAGDTEAYLLAMLMGTLQNHRCEPDFYPFEEFCFWITLPVWYLILDARTILTELNLSILEMNLEMPRSSFSAQPLPKKKTKQEKKRTDSLAAYHGV